MTFQMSIPAIRESCNIHPTSPHFSARNGHHDSFACVMMSCRNFPIATACSFVFVSCPD
jgi:hypothetical protein